jgi:hypothetical protein
MVDFRDDHIIEMAVSTWSFLLPTNTNAQPWPVAKRYLKPSVHHSAAARCMHQLIALLLIGVTAR